MIFSLLLAAAITTQSPSAKPNVIVIVSDDLGYGDVGYHGSDFHTPTIDRLALSGVRLNRFYGHTVCTPTRAAIMAGKFPFKVGLQGIIWPWNTHGLPAGLDTLGTVFKRAGYQTWAFGKWHLGHATPDLQPQNKGFDYHLGNFTGSIDPYDHTYYGVHDFQENGQPVYPKGYVADLITNKLIDKINGLDGSSPFFAYLAYTTPHLPYGSPYTFRQQYADLSDPNKSGLGAMITHMDSTIGELLLTLKKKNMDQNTYIWFLSDNGGWLDGAASNAPLRGGKATDYEGGIRLASFVVGPGLPANTTSDQFVHAVDIMPTLCALANITPPTGIDGQDVTGFLRGNTKKVGRTFTFTLGGSSATPVGVILYGRYKLITAQGRNEIYDVINDPSETNNLFPTNNNVLLNQLVSQYTQYHPDPYPLWFGVNGYPDGFVFPQYWGEPRVAAQRIQPTLKPPLDAPIHVLHGYPTDLELVKRAK